MEMHIGISAFRLCSETNSCLLWGAGGLLLVFLAFSHVLPVPHALLQQWLNTGPLPPLQGLSPMATAELSEGLQEELLEQGQLKWRDLPGWGGVASGSDICVLPSSGVGAQPCHSAAQEVPEEGGYCWAMIPAQGRANQSAVVLKASHSPHTMSRAGLTKGLCPQTCELGTSKPIAELLPLPRAVCKQTLGMQPPRCRAEQPLPSPL